MPFKSEAQRRYLWANEPEIARDWTDTYGSKIHAADGGIIRLPFQWGGPGSGRDERGYQSSHPSHSSQRNTGPINVHADTAPVIQQQRQLDLANIARQTNKQPDVFEQSWTGQPGIFGIGGGYKNLNVPSDTGAGHQSRFGIGNLIRGAMSMFGGIPGSIMSMLSRIDPRQLRGKNLDDSWRTQAQYEQARAERQLRNRIDRLRKTRDIGKYADDPEGWAASDLSGRLSDFENQLGITGIASDINYPGGEPVAQISDASLPYRHELEAVPPKNWNFDFTPFHPSQGGIMDIDTETTEELLPENDPFAGDDEETILEKAKRINAEIKTPLAEKVDTHPYTGESFRPKTGRNYEWLYGLQNEYGIPRTFIRDYDKRNEPYPFINYHPDDEEISIMRGY